jgi:hypothetical protein
VAETDADVEDSKISFRDNASRDNNALAENNGAAMSAYGPRHRREGPLSQEGGL